jgi:hypothetical protein
MIIPSKSKSTSAILLSSALLTLFLARPISTVAADSTDAKPPATSDATAAAKLEPKFSKPGLVTAAGQSSDIAVVKALLNTRLKLGLEIKPMAAAADLGDSKTLVVVLGASTKGMGAAGLDLDKELERTKAVVKAAKEKGIKILGLHVGGEARRGKTTNDLLEVVIPECTHVVVVASGNKDKMFNTLAAKNNVPLTEVQNLAGAGDAVKVLFLQ